MPLEVVFGESTHSLWNKVEKLFFPFVDYFVSLIALVYHGFWSNTCAFVYMEKAFKSVNFSNVHSLVFYILTCSWQIRMYF
jgi:hypothetical protein